MSSAALRLIKPSQLSDATAQTTGTVRAAQDAIVVNVGGL